MEVFGRFSVLKNDMGWEPYNKYGAAAGWRIMLDGEEVPFVKTVDADKGYVLANELDENGKAFIRNHDVATKELHGDVRIFIDDVK